MAFMRPKITTKQDPLEAGRRLDARPVPFSVRSRACRCPERQLFGQVPKMSVNRSIEQYSEHPLEIK